MFISVALLELSLLFTVNIYKFWNSILNETATSGKLSGKLSVYEACYEGIHRQKFKYQVDKRFVPRLFTSYFCATVLNVFLKIYIF